MDVQNLSKLDVARRQLATAIRMFFSLGDPIAIHTLAAASQGLLRDLAKASGAEHGSILHDNPHIPGPLREEWYRQLNQPRNFFKHADRDPDRSLEFKPEDNENLILDAVLLWYTNSHAAFHEASVYLGWFTTKHENLRAAISGNPIGEYCVRNAVHFSNYQEFLELLDSPLLIEEVRSNKMSESDA